MVLNAKMASKYLVKLKTGKKFINRYWNKIHYYRKIFKNSFGF